MQINSNLASLNAQRSFGNAQQALATSLQRLSSGQRINSAKDDAAGLAISDRMTATIRGLDRAGKNTNDAISLLQVADGALASITDNFQRLRELAVQAANGSNNDSDRASLQQEADALVAANFDAAASASFNRVPLLDGSFDSQFQIGANAGDKLAVKIPPVFGAASQGFGLVDVPLREATTSGHVGGALGAGELTINGSAIGAAAAGAQAGQSAASAFAAAAAINAANVNNVSASAANSADGGAGGALALAGGSLSINGVAVGAISGATAAQVATSAAAAFSAASGASGITAHASGAGFTLTAADGRDIVISDNVPGSAAALGLAAGTQHGTLTVDAGPAPTAVLAIGGSNPGAVGLTAGTKATTLSGGSTSVLQAQGALGEPRIDLGSFAGATAALTYIDGKLDNTTGIRGLVGATLRRLDSIAQGLQTDETNQQAARSRIVDTDYAAETAQLTRGQILQQAATAIVAQANALPNQALLLLR